MASGAALLIGIALALPLPAAAFTSAPPAHVDDAGEDSSAEACALQTSLLQTAAVVQVPRRGIANAGASPSAASLRRASRHDSDAAAHAKLLDADALAQSSLHFGPYGSEHARAYVGEYACGSSQHASVYFPVARDESGQPGRAPLISFAHGNGGGGPLVGLFAGTLLPFLASWGFVVVAHESELREYPSESIDAAHREENGASSLDGRITTFCENQTLDQIRSLEWASSSEFAERIDWERPTGIAGYSMGGTATLITALDAAAVGLHNIGAAFSIAPHFRTKDTNWERPLQTPIVLATGESDTVDPAKSVKLFFNSQDRESSTLPRIFASLAGADHQSVFNDEIYHPYAAALFRCHLKSHEDSCELVYADGEACACDGGEPCSLCSCSRVSCAKRHTPPGP